MAKKQRLILYVDDDADDRELLAAAIREADSSVEILFAHDGQEALQKLMVRKAANTPLPCLIILDLNMPLLNGGETLDSLAANAAFKTVPVMIFTSSEKPQDREFFSKKAIPFFTKPFNVVKLSEIVREMLNYCR